MSDPNWNDVALLLAFDGTNGSTTLDDLSTHNDDKTATSGAQVSTTRSKWGAASLKQTWVDADIPAWSGTRFNRASGQAYTMEGWIYVPTGSPAVVLAEMSSFAFLLQYDDADGHLYAAVEAASGNVALTLDAWHFWQYRALSDNTWAVRLDGTSLLSGSGLAAWSGQSFRIAGSSFGPSSAACDVYHDDVRITPGVARSTTVPTAAFEFVGEVSGYISESAGPLGEPAALGYSGVYGFVEVASVLGDAAVLGIAYSAGYVSDTGLLGVPSIVAQHDFTSFIGGVLLTSYVMNLQTPSGVVRPPISSWQATLQTDRQNYVQCVVPGCAPHVDSLIAATSFEIMRRVVTPGGLTIESWMASAPVTNLQFSRGSANFTAVISGYSDAFAADANPPASLDRTMTGIRTISSSNGTSRVSCDIDWLLRPGMRAIVSGDPLLVGYINYYANDSGQHMEIGERAEVA